MYYFLDKDNFLITERKYLYNAEVLDGTLLPLKEDTLCLLVGHLPSKKFTYGCWIKEKLPPEKGLERVKALGPKKQANKGEPFYSLVGVDSFQDYLDKNDYMEKSELGEYKAAKAAKTVPINPRRMEVSGEVKKEQKKNQSKKEAAPIKNYRGIKLHRDNETGLN